MITQVFGYSLAHYEVSCKRNICEYYRKRPWSESYRYYKDGRRIKRATATHTDNVTFKMQRLVARRVHAKFIKLCEQRANCEAMSRNFWTLKSKFDNVNVRTGCCWRAIAPQRTREQRTWTRDYLSIIFSTLPNRSAFLSTTYDIAVQLYRARDEQFTASHPPQSFQQLWWYLYQSLPRFPWRLKWALHHRLWHLWLFVRSWNLCMPTMEIESDCTGTMRLGSTAWTATARIQA